MGADLAGGCGRGGRLLALIAVLALRPLCCTPQAPLEAEAIPPPGGATDLELVEHLLAPELGHWTRAGEVRPPDVPPEPPAAAGLMDTARRFDLAAGGSAIYRAPGGSLDAHAVVLIMPSRLDALGVFAERRPAQSAALTLLSPAFWNGQALEAYSDRIYLHVSLALPHEAAQALARDLAAQLELRLPAAGRPPRLMRALPRRWMSPFSTRYGPVELCGFSPGSPAISATYELGNAPVSLAVLETPGREEARVVYGRLLTHMLGLGRPHEIPELADEAFACADTAQGTCLGLRQDGFVAWATTTGPGSDAEAVMRLVAIRIRTTRPLPHSDGGG